MDKVALNLFDHWSGFTKKTAKFFERTKAVLNGLGIPPDGMKIIMFISSAYMGEVKVFNSNNESYVLAEYVNTTDEKLAKEQLALLLKIPKEQSLFALSRIESSISYDDFGVIPEGSEEICLYGAAAECVHLGSSNKLITELLEQIIAYCNGVMGSQNFAYDEQILSNLVYTALKKQIDVDFYNTLAASDYEKKVASGGIILIGENTPCSLKIAFREKYPLEIHNVRQIRKLLELTAGDNYLISKKGKVVGVGGLLENCEIIRFNGHQRWSYFNGNREILSYKVGKYSLFSDDEKSYALQLPAGFICKDNKKHFNHIINDIKNQRHGAILIITDGAQGEVERLRKLNRGYAITPVDLKQGDGKKLLSSMTSIDGAIIVDTNFICFGIGMILDGIAVKPGLSSRGSRYNSSKCYVDNKERGKYAAVIISEDDTVDIYYR